VGVGGLNERGDVMLIQALFNFIADGHEISRTGLPSAARLPVLTGILDGRTIEAITAFQLRWMKQLLPSFAGKVFPLPAGYRMKSLSDKAPMLHMLNVMARDSTGGPSNPLPKAMLKAFPELLPLIRP